MAQARRPSGRLIYLVLAILAASSGEVAASAEGPAMNPERAASLPAAKAMRARGLPRAASPISQSGPTLTNVIDTVYRADGTYAQGELVITWPAFVGANGNAVSEGTLNVTLGANGALNVALAANAGANPAGVYYTVVYQLGPAVAAREIIKPEEFRQGISKIIDGTVQCLNASTWCKHAPAANVQPPA